MCQCNSNNINVSCVSCAVNPPSVQSGTSGVGVSSATITNGDLIITLTNGVVINAGTVEGTNGSNGLDGLDGLGIDSITYNNNNQLEITYTDNTVQTFTLKDKTFFIASTEASTVDVLNNSLVSPNVIAGDVRFNKDKTNFQIFDGTNWVTHFYVGSHVIKDVNSPSIVVPSSTNNGAGVSNKTLIFDNINTLELDALRIGDSLKVKIAGTISKALIDNLLSLETPDSAILQLEFRDNSGRIDDNDYYSTGNVEKNAYKVITPWNYSTFDVKIQELFPIHFLYDVLITKISNTSFQVSLLINQDYKYEGAFVGNLILFRAKALEGYLIDSPNDTRIRNFSITVPANNGLTLDLRYIGISANVSNFTDSLKITNYSIEKIAKAI